MSTGLLDSPVEDAFERLTSLAARTIQAPVSLVSLVDRERQFFKSAFGLPEPWLSKRETPLSHSFCRHVVETQMPLVIENAKNHPLVRENRAISDLRVIAYAGIPLKLKNGQCIGSFCVIDHKPRHWSPREIQLLADISESVMAEIELRLLMAAKEELLDVIFHDLKNPLSAILLNNHLIQQKAKGLNDPKIVKQSNTVRVAAERMKGIIQNISDLIHLEKGDLPLDIKVTSTSFLIETALKRTELSASQKKLTVIPQGEPLGNIRCDSERVAQAIADLVCVSIRRSPIGKDVYLKTHIEDHSALFEITDEGYPLSQEDLHNYFDRFVKLSGTPYKGAKLAICLANEIVQKHGGFIQIDALQNGKTITRVHLPLSL